MLIHVNNKFHCTVSVSKFRQVNLPQGIDLNENFPSAPDTAWQRAPSLGAPLKPCEHGTSFTSFEYKYR